MELGAFSVSLAVKDLAASRAFYEALGFEAFHGEATQGWLILRNGAATIGLFQGMFERNILTFNPGWDADAQPLDAFTDIREIQRGLKAAGHPARDGGRRGDDRPRERGHRGSGRQPDPVRPARLTIDHAYRGGEVEPSGVRQRRRLASAITVVVPIAERRSWTRSDSWIERGEATGTPLPNSSAHPARAWTPLPASSSATRSLPRMPSRRRSSGPGAACLGCATPSRSTTGSTASWCGPASTRSGAAGGA